MTGPNEQLPALNNKQALSIMRAVINRMFEIQLAEVDKDIARLEGLDLFDQIYLRARWSKAMDLMFAAYNALEKYDTPAGQIELVGVVFGDQLGLPASTLHVDIERRLEWYKRRAATAFERSVKRTIDDRSITSPIEQIFLMEWNSLSRAEVRGLELVPQRELTVQGSVFRIDFVVLDAENETLTLAIELDGHDFHERTKGQAARDRRRERTIVREGYTVLRFTGSEIVRDPRQCITEILDLTRSRRGTLS